MSQRGRQRCAALRTRRSSCRRMHALPEYLPETGASAMLLASIISSPSSMASTHPTAMIHMCFTLPQSCAKHIAVCACRERLWRLFIEDIKLERDDPAAASKRGRVSIAGT